MLTFNQVSKSYTTHRVLSVPGLTIPAGTYWLEGANGSGKTTLLKIIAGITPFNGTLQFNKIDIKKSPVAYRDCISFAEAEPLYPPMVTGWELIRFVQHARKETDQQVHTLIERTGIANFINRPVGQYSSGMVKKLSLMMAFIGQPHLILLDEPLITLDVNFVSVLLALIREKQVEGISFVITSHQPFEETDLALHGKLLMKDETLTLRQQ